MKEGLMSELLTRRRWLALVTAFASLLLAVLCVQPAFAFELDATDGSAEANRGFTWDMQSGVLLITTPDEATYEGYCAPDAPDPTLSIPSTVGGETVTRAQVNCNAGSPLYGPSYANEEIKTVVFPRTIEDMAFTSSESLPYRLGSVEEVSFAGEGNVSLQSIGYPQRYGQGPMFPSTLKKFNAGEVDGEYYDFVIPDSLTDLRRSACQNISITSLYVPASLTTTYSGGYAAFKGCADLTQVTNASDVWLPLPDCPNVIDLKMEGHPDSVMSSACENWENLESVDIPADVTSVGSKAFAGCNSLESVKFGGEELLTIDAKAFDGCASLKTLTIPESVTEIGVGAFANTGIEAIKLPAGLYSGCDIIRFSEEPDFGEGAGVYTTPLFSDVAKAHLLDDPANLNTTLKSVDMMDYQQYYIPSYLFAGCSSLEQIAIPRTVRTLMAGIFVDCTSLDEVYYYGQPSSLTIATTQSGTSGLGYDYVTPGTFSQHVAYNAVASTDYEEHEGLTFYGLGISGDNALVSYAEAHDDTFVPFAFLGEGGSSDAALSLFGSAMPANVLSAPDIASGGTPTITAAYPYDPEFSRTLADGQGCTITYTHEGREVSDFYAPGTYTATVTGQGTDRGGSVWGTDSVDFTVTAPPVADIPVEGDTGATASGSLYGPNVPDGASPEIGVTPLTPGNPAYEALLGAMGTGDFAGAYDVVLTIDGEEVHDGFGAIHLTFPVDSRYDGRWATVWHRHLDGSITSQRVQVVDGTVGIDVTDLSSFAVEIGDEAVNPTPVPVAGTPLPGSTDTLAASGSAMPATGDGVPAAVPVALVGASLFALGALALSRRRGHNRNR